MRVIETKVLYRDPRFYAAFPALVAWPDGRCLVLFRRARDQRYLFTQGDDPDYSDFDSVDHLDCRSEIAALTLDADLESMAGPVGLSVNAEAGDQDASLLRLRDGRLILSGFSWYPFERGYDPAWRAKQLDAKRAPRAYGRRPSALGFKLWGSYTRVSDDRGKTWSPHLYLPPLPGFPDLVPGRRPAFGGACRGQAIETREGDVLLASYLGEPPDNKLSGSHLYRSKDRGNTWSYAGRIALDPAGKASYVEPALLQTPTGSIVAFHRTFGLDDRLATSRSDDGGASWSRPRTWPEVKGHPPHPLKLPDGRVFLSYGFRHTPFGIRAALLDPEAEGIVSPEVVIRDDSPSPDAGYPWAASLPDGRVIVVYYFCDRRGRRHIVASTLSVE